MTKWCLNKLIERKKDVTVPLRRALISWPKGRSMAERARSTRAWWKSKPWLHLHTNIAHSAILVFYLSTCIAPKVSPLRNAYSFIWQKPLNYVPYLTHIGDNYASKCQKLVLLLLNLNSPSRYKLTRSIFSFDPLTLCVVVLQLPSSCFMYFLYPYHEWTQDLLDAYLVTTFNWR